MATRSGRPPYVPERGDLVWLTFDPQAGHEQAGRRPAVVLSPRFYNTKAGLALFAPITHQVKGYPFEVALLANVGANGVVLADQIKSLDWRARDARRIGELPATIIATILARSALLLAAG